MAKRFRSGRTLVLAAALGPLAAGGERGGEGERSIRLDVIGGAGAPQEWPRSCCIELPPSFLQRGERLAILDSSGTERPARVLACGSDASGRPTLARVDFDELPRDARSLELRGTRLAAAAPRLRAERAGPALVLATTADDGAASWQDSVLTWSSGDARLELALGRLGLADDGEERAPGRIGPLRVTGPDGAGAELSLPLHWPVAVDEDEAAADLRIDVAIAIAGSGRHAELELTFVAPHELLVRRLVVRGRAVGEATLRRGEEALERDARGGQNATASGRIGVVPPDERAAEGAPLRLVAGSGRARVELAWPDFGLARPSAAALRADGSFTLDLVAEPLLMHAGQTLRRTLRLLRGDRVGRELARPFVIARAALRSASTLDEASREWLAPWRDFARGWLAQPRRLDDRGCYEESWGALANGEYDLGGSLLWLGRIERDAGWLECGEAIARHTLEWDRGTPPIDEAPRGLFFQHGDDHASGKVEAGHQWVGGPLELARATGSLAALDAARGLVGALAIWRDQQPGRFHGPERRLAWPLRVAVEVDRATGDPAAARLGERFLRELLARQAAGGFVDGDRRKDRDGVHVWLNTWVSLGITVDALARAEQAFPGGGAHEAALRLARFVADAALTPDGIAEVLQVDPELGAVMERRGRCTDGEAALAAAGLDWLARQSGERTLATRAAALREAARSGLAAPSAKQLTSLAQALLALRFELESAAAPDPRQSRSSPSSVRPPLRPKR